MTEELSAKSIVYQLLAKNDNRKTFDCGDEALNSFLQRYALQHQKREVSRTFVAKEQERSEILGFYTLSSSQVRLTHLPENKQKRLPRHPVPMVRIARLARDLSVRGQGMGELLLVDALLRIVRLSDDIGIYAAEVDAKHEQAKTFYESFGFESLQDDPLHLYLPIRDVKEHVSS